MNCKIPFTKDIDMTKKVSEITSISLEHEIRIEDETLKGNFIVSGEFKSHEVSVNKEAFSYILPFEIELADDIDTNTVEFMIDDFTYEIVNLSNLRVNIDFNVMASKKEKVEEEIEEPLFQDARELFGNLEEEQDVLDLTEDNREVAEEKKSEELLTQDVFEEASVLKEEIAEKKEDKKVETEENMDREVKNEEKKEDNIKEEPKKEIKELKDEKEEVRSTEKQVEEEHIEEEHNEEEENRKLKKVKVEEKITKETEDTIIKSIENTNDEYITYHIHMVSDGESVETICTMYNSNVNILAEYNDLTDVVPGDKLIIPEINE